MDDFQKALLTDEVADSGGEVIVPSLSIFQRTQKKKAGEASGWGCGSERSKPNEVFLGLNPSPCQKRKAS